MGNQNKTVSIKLKRQAKKKKKKKKKKKQTKKKTSFREMSKGQYIIKQLLTIEVLDMTLKSILEYQYWSRLSAISAITIGILRWISSHIQYLNSQQLYNVILILLLLNTTCPVLANSVDPDQMASEKPTDPDLHCLSLNMWISIKNHGSSNLIGWKLEVGVAS